MNETQSLIRAVQEYGVKGFLADDEAAALYELARDHAHLGSCLEVGSYCGKSTVFLGSGCRQREAVLFAVDHHRGSEEHQVGEEYHDPALYDASAGCMDSLPELRRTLRIFALEDTVLPVVARSEILVRHWTIPLALVFIDGGHSHAAARADCLSWSRQIMPGGILAVHDIFINPEDGGQGPYLALQAVLASGDFIWLETVRSLGILRRR